LEISTASEHSVFSLAIADSLGGIRNMVMMDPTNQIGLMILVVVNERDPKSFERLFSLINEVKPSIIWSKPPIFEEITEFGSFRRKSIEYSPDFVVSTGSLLDVDLRKKTEDFFNSKVIDAYGLTEFGLIASECSKQDGLHLNEDWTVVEILDEEGRPVEDDKIGEIVISNLRNEAMPLIRYRSGDLASLSSTLCTCGHPGIRLTNLSGRKISCFRLESGKLVSPAHLGDEMYRLFPLSEFQITQVSLNEFEVLVEPAAKSESDKLITEIQRYLQNSLDRWHVSKHTHPVKVSVRKTSFRYLSKFERYRTLI